MIEFNPSLSITYKWQKKYFKAYKNEHYASLNEMQIGGDCDYKIAYGLKTFP